MLMVMEMKERSEPSTPYLRERGRAGGNSSQEGVRDRRVEGNKVRVELDTKRQGWALRVCSCVPLTIHS